MIKERNTTIYNPDSNQSPPSAPGQRSNQTERNNHQGNGQPEYSTPPKKQGGGHQQGGSPGVSKRNTSGDKNWRDSNDYRRDYFDQHNGICGYLYVCSQCFKPMFKKSSMQVDHIVPPSRFAVSKIRGGQHVKTSMMARFLNHSFNCVAICPHCNQSKGNKMDYRVGMGFAMKAIELSHTAFQFILSIPFVALATTMWIARGALTPVFRLLGNATKSTFKKVGSRK